ncbi:G5 domain protein [Kribbella flavida DSM 17836]|uniref:G5 domain protein n=1 Tax=Kribbella flavida (strain DSM 17836 / JCM 10339 / NBRC 14399) TaxID=479435 RepID=D2Q2C0_KRIFD|nr:G5 domain-containing protein [Kribbella flavida]ADB35816.1 G5 domain protein [Kribbella flavida DSM 17836]
MRGGWVVVVVGLAGLVGGCAAESGGDPSAAGSAVPAAAPVSRAPTSTPSNPPPSTPSSPVPESPPSKAAQPVRPSAPVLVRRLVVETRAVAFRRVTEKDASLESGERVVTTKGRAGVQRLTYEVTSKNGVQVRKRLVRRVVSRQPVAEVTTIGTKKAAEETSTGGCDPNYSGCVPIASDVDCSGGSGNGPEYVAGPVQVTGSDVYRLDADNDGIGCED